MGRKAVLYLLGNLFILFTAAMLVAAVACRMAPSQTPTCGWIVAGLAAPFVFAVNVLLLVWWLVRRRWAVAVLPLAALVVGGADMGLLVQPPRLSAAPETRGLRVATLNVHGFQHEQSRGLSARSIASMLEDERIDVACLQEVLEDADHPFTELAGRFGAYPYYVRELSMACFSRYPILDHEYVRFPASNQSYLRVDVAVEGRTVRFVSVHLQSTGISMAQRRFRRDYGCAVPSDTLCRMMEDNALVRLEQVRAVRRVTDSMPELPLVVLGDFNDTPVSVTYRAMSRGLKDAFRMAGHGWSGSYRGVVGIDHILYNDRFVATDCYVWRDAELSDHDPVIAELHFVP